MLSVIGHKRSIDGDANTDVFVSKLDADLSATTMSHPVYVSSITFSPTRVDVTFSENMLVAGVTPSDFAISGTLANGPITVTGLTVSGDTIQMTLDASLTGTDIINVSYTESGTSPTDLETNTLNNFGAQIT